MHLLIGDLLDVARIETGVLAVSPGTTDAAMLVSEARSAFRSGGGRHGIEIDLKSGLLWAMADRARMVQVLGSLLSNAAKNSPESSPIRVSATSEGVHVAVSVSDEGRGIPAQSLPRLFRKFSRIDFGEQGAALAWALPSARVSWRPTGPASGPRATGRAWGALHLHAADGGTGRFRLSNPVGCAVDPLFASGGAGAGAGSERRPPGPPARSGRAGQIGNGADLAGNPRLAEDRETSGLPMPEWADSLFGRGREQWTVQKAQAFLRALQGLWDVGG
ncbi:MAG: HAMP domain-containing sensor histidine kinase [Chloroflexi bacterium]|nr:HAMP domain-containing sensor histidine kinase [Chloroflexota bacterium]